MPSVELVYPAKGCRERWDARSEAFGKLTGERFVLLAPTSAGEYHPIMEMRHALRTILDRESSQPATLSHQHGLSDYIPPSHRHIFGTLSDLLPDLEATTYSVSSRLHSPQAFSLNTPPPDTPITTETIGDALRKSLASNRRDGPGFIRAMERFNTAMENLQADGSLMRYVMSKPGVNIKDWSGIVETVHEMAYSRVVGPYSNELEVR